METNEILEVLEKIAIVFGPYLGTLFFITLLSIIGILWFFKRRIEKIAEDISAKSLKIYETKLNLSLRNEAIRQDLILYLGKKSIDKKLEFYDKVYSLYFKYQKSWFFNDKTPEEEINSLGEEIMDLRRMIFLSSVYLGGDLTEHLLKAVILMHTLLEETVTKIKQPHKYRYSKYSYSKNESFISETNLDEYLNRAQKYIADKLYAHQETSQYDFSQYQKQLLEKEKEKIFQ